MDHTLRSMEERITALASAAEIDSAELPTFGYLTDDGRPCVLIEGSLFLLVARERGREVTCVTSSNPAEFCYMVISKTAHTVFAVWAREMRLPYVNARLLGLARELSTLEQLDVEWRSRRERDVRHMIPTASYSPTDLVLGTAYLPVSQFARYSESIGKALVPGRMSVSGITGVLAERGLRDRGLDADKSLKIAIVAAELVA